MDAALGLTKELSALLLVFGALFAYAIIRGQRALLSLVFGLYIALLISVEFPYYDKLTTALSFMSEPAIRMTMFAIFTAFGSILFERLLSRLLDETAIEGIGKKVILSALATALIMSYSYHVLPITTLIDPGAKISSIFAPQDYFFWWLLAPLVGIMLIF
jgi:hypothetical protein